MEVKACRAHIQGVLNMIAVDGFVVYLASTVHGFSAHGLINPTTLKPHP